MLLNPLTQPLFVPTAIMVGGVLLLGLIALFAAGRGDVRRLAAGTLFRRWRTWAVIAPIYALAVLSGAVPTLALVLFLAGQGLREYANLVGLPNVYRLVLLLILATLQPLLLQDVKTGVRNLAFAALGFAYVPWLLGFFVLTQMLVPGGAGLLLVLGLGVALSDVGAFAVGSTLGRHKLSPVVSPNKTWEGVAGNALGAAAGVALMWYALPEWLPLGARLALPLVLALAAVWGDLVESLLKREFAVKDAGDWLPGFGGLLDRIDSLLLAVPLNYYFALAVRAFAAA